MYHTNADLDPLTFSDRIAQTICVPPTTPLRHPGRWLRRSPDGSDSPFRSSTRKPTFKFDLTLSGRFKHDSGAEPQNMSLEELRELLKGKQHSLEIQGNGTKFGAIRRTHRGENDDFDVRIFISEPDQFASHGFDFGRIRADDFDAALVPLGRASGNYAGDFSVQRLVTAKRTFDRLRRTHLQQSSNAIETHAMSATQDRPLKRKMSEIFEFRKITILQYFVNTEVKRLIPRLTAVLGKQDTFRVRRSLSPGAFSNTKVCLQFVSAHLGTSSIRIPNSFGYQGSGMTAKMHYD
ncbi:unnamed protein product [Nesidiocoris tenuis]|uniref:Uncharacterized protein n=1 Tax=Nesidiocoris tenuis TaxID=355587 RepID=A0A6H5G072_9HEMI|nr:unnamed protein product [Nesidiocoris tenuis]